jgi:hypothetical protein
MKGDNHKKVKIHLRKFRSLPDCHDISSASQWIHVESYTSIARIKDPYKAKKCSSCNEEN